MLILAALSLMFSETRMDETIPANPSAIKIANIWLARVMREVLFFEKRVSILGGISIKLTDNYHLIP